MSDPNFTVPMEIRTRLCERMADILTTKGYYYSVVTIATIWENFKNLDRNRLPALYVTNDSDDANLLPVIKFGQHCPLDEVFRMSIMGRLAKPSNDVNIEDVQEKAIQDVKRAYMVDPSLNHLVEPMAWHVRRPQPWLPADGRLYFQVLLTVKSLGVHYRA